MGYFDKFPTLYYDLKGTKKFEVAVDILRRVRIDYRQADTSMYGEYAIKEHDRPDTIADKLYGDSELHWVVLLFNEIHNPYYEWPMTTSDLIKYCESKYPGKAFLLDLDKITDSPLESVRKRRDHKAVEGNYVFTITGTQLDLDGPIGYLVCWDRTLGKAIVIEESGAFAPGDHIGIAVTGSYEATASGVIRRAQINLEALHHFEDDNGMELAPLASYNGLVQAGTQMQTTSTVDEYGRTAPLPFEETLLGAYLNPLGEAELLRAVTNLEYEERINEARRTIILPHPDIVRSIASKFQSIVNEEL